MGDAHGDVSGHVKTYMLVFAALFAGTLLTVFASTVDMGKSVNMLVAVGIAVVKASLVAAIFMHLKWERSISIWWPLALCAFFFAVLMLVPLLVSLDMTPNTVMRTWGS